MVNRSKNNTGMRLLIEECRKRFRIPENLYHYAEDDFREAERKYIKFSLFHGNIKKSEKGG